MTILARPLSDLTALHRYYAALDGDAATAIAQRLAWLIEVKQRWQRLATITAHLREVM